MADRQELIELLEASGSVKQHDPNGHIRYKLPSGRILISAGTPSDVRGYSNALAFLRRELRSTHPGLANNFKRSLPKNKRHTTNSLGDLLAAKTNGNGTNGNGDLHLFGHIPSSTAIPGSQSIPPPEIPYSVIEPEPEYQPLPTVSHKAPRKPYEPRAKAPPARTLSAQQLIEANRILQTEGKAAMDGYISRCHENLVEVTTALISERFPAPMVVEENHVYPLSNSKSEEEQFMDDLLERARKEYQATNERLASYEGQINALRAQEDADVLKQTQLEQYIARHEALANEAVQLLGILPKEAPKARPATAASKKEPKKLSRHPYIFKDIAQPMLLKLLEMGKREFSTTDALVALGKCPNTDPLPKRAALMSWLFAETAKNSGKYLTKGGPGIFIVVDSIQLPRAETEDVSTAHLPMMESESQGAAAA
jgi:hypothetical protein